MFVIWSHKWKRSKEKQNLTAILLIKHECMMRSNFTEKNRFSSNSFSICSMSKSCFFFPLVGFEPVIDQSDVPIEQISIHFCNPMIHRDAEVKIWFDDKTRCQGPQAMLVYEWTGSSSFSRFQLSNGNEECSWQQLVSIPSRLDVGFLLEKSFSLVVSIVYLEEQTTVNDHSGVTFYLSTRM